MRKTVLAGLVAVTVAGPAAGLGVAGCGEDRGGVEIEGGTTGTAPGTTPTGTATEAPPETTTSP